MNRTLQGREDAAYWKAECLLRNMGMTGALRGAPLLITLIGDCFLRRIRDGTKRSLYGWAAGKHGVTTASAASALRSVLITLHSKRTGMLALVMGRMPERLDLREFIIACVDWMDTHEYVGVPDREHGMRHVWRTIDPDRPISITDPLNLRQDFSPLVDGNI